MRHQQVDLRAGEADDGPRCVELPVVLAGHRRQPQVVVQVEQLELAADDGDARDGERAVGMRARAGGVGLAAGGPLDCEGPRLANRRPGGDRSPPAQDRPVRPEPFRRVRPGDGEPRGAPFSGEAIEFAGLGGPQRERRQAGRVLVEVGDQGRAARTGGERLRAVVNGDQFEVVRRESDQGVARTLAGVATARLNREPELPVCLDRRVKVARRDDGMIEAKRHEAPSTDRP
jgi:hypothetical protein